MKMILSELRMISVASRLKPRTISAAVAYFLDMEGVTGSIPVSSTRFEDIK